MARRPSALENSVLFARKRACCPVVAASTIGSSSPFGWLSTKTTGLPVGMFSAFSTTPGFFTARHQTLLESFADQAGIAIQNARFFEESQRRARETQALYEAGRAVNQSLEVGETIRLILNQAREVLGVQSCGLFSLDAATGELALVASLDLEPATARIRVRVGEGITGLAVKERRPVQSSDLDHDPRHHVRYRQLPAGSGLRSMLAASMCRRCENTGGSDCQRSSLASGYLRSFAVSGRTVIDS